MSKDTKELIIVIVGLLLIIAGICIGAYVGLWWAFVGGIIQLIHGIRAEELNAVMIACGIVKIMFAGSIGVLIGFIPVITGVFLMNRK